MCNNNYSCIVSGLIAVLLGFLVGLLVFLGLISNLTIGLIIAIISAFLISVCLFVTIILPRYICCIIKHSCGVLVGILGTIFFSTVGLSITLSANILSAIIIGVVVFFLTFLVIKFFRMITCIIYTNELDDTEEPLSSVNENINLNDVLSTDINNKTNEEFRIRKSKCFRM